MTVSPAPRAATHPNPARRFGYTIAIGVNLALIYVVDNLLEWETLPFLTNEFDRLLPLVTLSLLAGVVVNLFYLWDDAPRVKSIGQILTTVISMVVAVRTWVVFPFDFSEYNFNWSRLTRGILVMSMIGLAVAIITELVKLAKVDSSVV